jgi:nicotinamidase-related amidase
MDSTRRHAMAAAAAIFLAAWSVPSSAQTIISEWSSVKTPAAPELKSVTIDPKTTALLLLDFVKQACNEKVRPRCVATLPAAKKLLTEARANKVLVVYSFVMGGVMGDTLPEVAPNGDEPAVQALPNKFLNTDLEKILKDHGIKTVIVTGTAAHGAVLQTGAEAIFRGFNAIVPVDTVSAENAFVELYVAYDFVSAPRLSAATTLTSVDMIKF